MSQNPIKKFTNFFHQFGGLKLLKAYAKLGLLGKAFGCFWWAIRKNRLSAGYARMSAYVQPVLIQEFTATLERLNKENSTASNHSLQQTPSSQSRQKNAKTRRVWTCWLQGEEHAPEVVKCCIQSLKQNIKDREVVVLDESNINQFVTLPNFIEKKYKEGIIPKAHYSDLLRLELLYTYGGTWIDSTVLFMSSNYPSQIFGSDFFMPQGMPNGKHDGTFHAVSNWFITAQKGHFWLKAIREMLYDYWKKYDCLLDYYIFHSAVSLMASRQPNVWREIFPLWNMSCLQLQEHLFEPFKEKPIQKLLSYTPMQKLTYKKISNKQAQMKGTFYDVLVKGNLSTKN